MLAIPSEKDLMIKTIRKNLNLTILEIAEILKSENNEELLTITFSDIFDVSSIRNVDECLAEMVKHSEKLSEYLSISEIHALLKCERSIISDTIKMLLMGGINEWKMSSIGQKRGMKYRLEKKND